MIKFADTKIENQQLLNDIKYLLSQGQFINGEWNRTFSNHWTKECGAQYCVPTASGMAALISALQALENVDYVILPNLSFAASAFAVIEAGLSPIYCAVNEKGLLDQENCLEIIHKVGGVPAVMPVYLYGQWFEIDPEILDLAYVVEDACQAHGVVKKVQGQAAAFSFYPSKNLGAAGDAGAIVTNDEKIKSYCEKYINYGDKPGQKYTHEISGNNLRMDELQALILSKKIELGLFDFDRTMRQGLSKMYRERVKTFVQSENNSYHLFPILSENRDALRSKLKDNLIETGNHYPYTLSQVCLGNTQYISKNDHSEKIANHVVTLPIGSHLLPEHIRQVTSHL